ncbi:hypothetical protein V9L05_22885 (plasmid) [Bernardetia sp. Wsw4-3y2]|uniref:hypothetical protein n=1 Tax=Bernardetia sp. Wsw4-3y2 TaxID=3127471 RepID=UPI0030D372B7
MEIQSEELQEAGKLINEATKFAQTIGAKNIAIGFLDFCKTAFSRKKSIQKVEELKENIEKPIEEQDEQKIVELSTKVIDAVDDAITENEINVQDFRNHIAMMQKFINECKANGTQITKKINTATATNNSVITQDIQNSTITINRK